MRILVCGGRDYYDRDCVFGFLDRVHNLKRITCIIQGDATGADALAKAWAILRNVPHEDYAAGWNDLSAPDAIIKTNRKGKRYDARAGYRRNKRMLEEGKPDRVIAFPGGRGTADMCKQAKIAGVRVLYPFLEVSEG